MELKGENYAQRSVWTKKNHYKTRHGKRIFLD